MSPEQIAVLVEQVAASDGPALLTVLATALTVTVLIGGILAGVIKWVILPNLRDVIRQQGEIHKQVTENHHSNDQPTLLDRLDDIERKVEQRTDAVERKVDKIDAKVDRLDDKVDGHLISAAGGDGARDARITETERRLDRGGL